jgi:hypothetical protein
MSCSARADHLADERVERLCRAAVMWFRLISDGAAEVAMVIDRFRVVVVWNGVSKSDESVKWSNSFRRGPLLRRRWGSKGGSS